MNYKFKVSDKVMVTDPHDGFAGLVGRVELVDDFDYPYGIPYKVRFEGCNYEYDWYSGDDLELVKTASEAIESPQATLVLPEVNKVVVDPLVPSEQVSEGRKYDSGKPRYSLLPSLALEEVVHVLTFGSQKYEDFNWMKVQNANDRYFSAANRHLWQWKRGEIMDNETKRHHLASAITNLMFILELELADATRTE